MDNSLQPAPDKNYCLHCGHPNPLWVDNCEKCFKKLTPVDGVDLSTRKINRSRPGCVTVYAVLLFIQAGWSVLGGVLFMFIMNAGMLSSTPELSEMGIENFRTLGTIGLILLFIIIGLTFLVNVLMGWGLWNLKNWARILVIALHGLGLCVTLGSIIISFIANTSRNTGNPMAMLFGGFFNLVIAGTIIYWFLTNGDYFD
jgi:hypothetical protein